MFPLRLDIIFLRAFTEGDVDLFASDEFWDPHAIAGLLKTFFRDLPASILTRELHLRFLAVIGPYRSLSSGLALFNIRLQTSLTQRIVLGN